ncbi:helix-turn-helix domain-containing protein [Sedimentitalea sp. JM2-8]|uniref:Helix-turn-helix domain-containing protein n=1 Tax=Sedimentitalea xiamensis TaxID=3050037 RepID=A0ABT7FEW6_9RHOB|nr:helix-turn-helix domain-containing protein [Sedimentitalea xiamensis]MDK3073533.1 helix-turn-helix domain-containing protein [Sedimentitalea xiamensis]
MAKRTDDIYEDGIGRTSIFDAEPPAEADLWFLAPPPEDSAPTDMPWPMAARQASLDPDLWRDAEARCYRGLLDAAQAVARFGERLRRCPEGAVRRIALRSVAAALHGEGTWLPPEQIALYQVLRIGADDSARDLARAGWAVRRLCGGAGAPGPLDGLHGFLGRDTVQNPQAPPGEDRPVGAELDLLGDRWAAAVAALADLHPLTRAAYGFAVWRGEALTPWDDLLEPAVAAMLVGAGGLAPFLPLAVGHRLDRGALAPGPEAVQARLAQFLAAAEAGALAALRDLARLIDWAARAGAATADLSGKTPPALIDALTRFPVVSAELVAETAGCSRPAARRNLALFTRCGLIREITGQDRYRFWTVAA